MRVQAGEGQAEVNGLQISNAFSLNPDSSPGCPTASFNPGRGSGPVGLAQNGDMGAHNRAGDESCVFVFILAISVSIFVFKNLPVFHYDDCSHRQALLAIIDCYTHNL